MKNIVEMRNELISLYADMKEGLISPKAAKELTNTAGKVLLSAKVQMEYNKQMRLDRTIGFLDVVEDAE